MNVFSKNELKKLYIPAKTSHKGQNGKLTIIGGSQLFHGASLWALKVASRIVDMVFYSSTSGNNRLTEKLKGEVYDFIAVPRDKIEEYIEQSDAVLIGPGLAREDGRGEDEESTKALTERLLKKFPSKKWVIDAGSLQMMRAGWLKELNGNVIITPHRKEFEELFGDVIPNSFRNPNKILKQVQDDIVKSMAKEYNCVILLKGATDIICPPFDSSSTSLRPRSGRTLTAGAQGKIRCTRILGGNEGMTKGGTGDVLAGLVAALACKNDLFLAAKAASFINKKAGESLFKRVGPYFNASDLADEIPRVMKELIVNS